VLNVLVLIVACAASTRESAVIQEVRPACLRAGEPIALLGRGFGAYDPDASEVRFGGPAGEVIAGTPNVWRDDLIEVRVPTGTTGFDTVHVIRAGARPASHAVYQLSPPEGGGAPTFVERTQIVNHDDVSNFLGRTDQNLARTKDADVGDVDCDGWPDLIDNNSNNETNMTHAILRVNQSGASFDGFDWEPYNPNDTGSFVVQVDPGDDYVFAAICYDADFVDLNNDLLPDWVMAANNVPRIRVAMNGHLGVPGAFEESTQAWLGAQSIVGAPDDISTADVDGDGFVDVLAGIRFSSTSLLYLNNAGASFQPPITIQHTAGGFSSMHDSFFLDANDDGFWDIFQCNESGVSQLHLHDGNLVNPSWIPDQAFNYDATTGLCGDFNGDQVDDFALGDSGKVSIFLNSATSPGTFTELPATGLPGFGLVYDIEAGDIDLDGHLDLVAAIITTTLDDNGRIWLGNGDGTLSNQTAGGLSQMLPNPTNYQRLSADLIDHDQDGDLDLYLTGADGSGAPGAPFGSVPNQFWENELVDEDPVTYCTGKVHTGGCVATIATTGTASTTLAIEFEIEADDVLHFRNGLFFYGLSGPDNTPFLGGTLCAAPPIRRGTVTNSGGNPGDPCSGSYVFDFNAWIQGGNDPNVMPGTQVNGQFWFRDPPQPDGTGSGLSNAVQFVPST